MLDFSGFFRGFAKKETTTTITNISIKYMGDAHGLDGMEVRGSVFELKIPFQNKTGSDLLADNLKRPDLKIEGISVSAPFKLVGVNPKLPVLVKYQEGVELKLKIKVPDLPYSGPLSINLGEKDASMVRVEIQKIVAISKNARVDLEEAPSVLSVQKDQVLKRDVQLYKVLKYGDIVNGIKVNDPFVFSGSDPKLPFRLDQENSFIVSIYVLAPEFSYAGPLELTFS